MDLNWRRSQAYFVLCAAVLAASFALLSNNDRVADVLVVLAFIASLVITGLAAVAGHTQHQYYRAARHRKLALERRLGLGEFALETTPGMGSSHLRRFGRVTTLQNLAFGMLAIVSASGALVASGLFGGLVDNPVQTGKTVETSCATTARRVASPASPGIQCRTVIRP
ncbi:hypothetical protein AB0L40_06975 [Patulibacter sp. NPDC049589]|uniref:hypothetical protein n=1 Tax=Patulibacter sp. NPDC049589 TaxID=3154731 RepID=UPI0034258FCC